MTKQGGCFERPNFIMANRKSEYRSADSRRCRKMVAGAGSSRWCKTRELMQNWYSLVVRSGGHWRRTVSCCCWTGSCWSLKLVAGAGLVAAAAAGLVAAAAGR